MRTDKSYINHGTKNPINHSSSSSLRSSFESAMRDVNLELASLLYDMAAVAADSQRAWGYKRAAKAVLRIDRDITPLITSNTFRAISGIGPTTDRIARELIHDGSSAFVERAVSESGKEDEVARLRGFRRRFLSRAAVGEILSRKGT